MTPPQDRPLDIRPAWFFAFFLVSGFCGLVYQVVWLRLSMAAFGVTAPMVSLVISVFMAGLALGSWAGGRLGEGGRFTPLRLYAWAELAIATSGVLVPLALQQGRQALVGASTGLAWGSLGHYLASGAIVTLALLPFCTCMGATFPLAMAAIRRRTRADSSRSFSYLYVANVIGACSGVLLSSLILIELFGFRGTLGLAALLNAALAVAALALDRRPAPAGEAPGMCAPAVAGEAGLDRRRAVVLFALFATGFSSMGMEVVWVRQLTPFLGTMVYAFALILALYLAATFTGSILYRRQGRTGAGPSEAVTWPLAWAWMGFLGLLALASADARLGWDGGLVEGAARAVLAIVPLCLALGFFTPMLLDRWSRGDPGRAGSAYAVNMLGCILGPLAAGFVLLPTVGERGAIIVLALPLLAVGLAGSRGAPRARGVPVAVAVVSVALVASTRSYEDRFPEREVRRDYTATVVATGEGMGRQLLVNGIGMTKLTPLTKLMAHLPLVHVDGPPQSGLAVCLGMGVTFRSIHSWGIESEAVELVPSVPSLLPYFLPDEDALLHSPRARIAIDDGRRFLERSPGLYDVITIDPPPPITSAGASLLYSREFCELARSRLRPGGVLQHWLPAGDPTIVTAVTRAISESFPHVRAFSSIEGWGVHYLASDRPLPRLSPTQAASRLPSAARADLLEWGPAATAEEQFDLVLRRELSVDGLLGLAPGVPSLRDDHPVNEYYLVRTALRRAGRQPDPPR